METGCRGAGWAGRRWDHRGFRGDVSKFTVPEEEEWGALALRRKGAHSGDNVDEPRGPGPSAVSPAQRDIYRVILQKLSSRQSRSGGHRLGWGWEGKGRGGPLGMRLQLAGRSGF